jgi:hypothetical protein
MSEPSMLKLTRKVQISNSLEKCENLSKNKNIFISNLFFQGFISIYLFLLLQIKTKCINLIVDSIIIIKAKHVAGSESGFSE